MTRSRISVLTLLVCLASAGAARAACNVPSAPCELTITKDTNGYHLTGYPSDKIYHTNAAGLIKFKFNNQTGAPVGIRLDGFNFKGTSECPGTFYEGQGKECSGLQDDVDKNGKVHMWAKAGARNYTEGTYNFTFYIRPNGGDWQILADPELEIDRMGFVPLVVIVLVLVVVVGVGLTLLVRALQERRSAK